MHEALADLSDGAVDGFRLRDATAADGPWIADLRLLVLRPSLAALGRYQPERNRRFFTSAYAPQNTAVVLVHDRPVGSIALRRSTDGTWVEHFYLAPGAQGAGLGGTLLGAVTRFADRTGEVLRLDVLVGSPARRLYERHGFSVFRSDPFDVFMERTPVVAGVEAPREPIR